MILDLYINNRGEFYGTGYIAGTADGIVTVAGVPSSREVCLYALYHYKPMVLVDRVWSTGNGNYMFGSLDASIEYLVMVRDYGREFEPFTWDYVKPATDITNHEQYLLEKSWH